MTITSAASAAQLRSRACVVRGLARRFDDLAILECFRRGGANTWVGPSPQRCDDALRGYPAALRAEADSLVIAARRLERVAAEIESSSRLLGPH